MLLPIDDNKSVAELQDRFNECFPHLKIEFYHHSHHWKEGSPEAELISPEANVGDIRKKHDPGILEIKSWYQTGRVEQDLKKLFGLYTQIFRLENGKWKQTGSSDKLTLKQQEQMAVAALKMRR